MELAYAYKPKNKDASVKAIARDLNMSPKDAILICDVLRGMPLDKAIAYLKDVVALKKPVPHPKYNKSTGHRKEDGFGPGRYPQKAAREILLLLENLTTNAEYKGLSPEGLKLTHIQALKGITRRKRKPKGRWKVWRTQLVHLQAICEGK